MRRSALAILLASSACLTDPATFSAATSASTSAGTGGATGTSSASTADSTAASSSAESGAGGGHPSVRWVLSAGGQKSETLSALAVDHVTGTTYIAGSWEGPFTWPGTVIGTCNGPRHAFVARIEPTGTPGWADCFAGDATVHDVELAKDGSLVLAGDFKGLIEGWGASIQSANGSRDGFVARYTEVGGTGSRSWLRPIGGSGDDAITGLTATQSTLFLAGTFEGSLDAGASTLTSTIGADVFLLTADLTGGVLDGRAYGDASDSPEVHVDVHAGVVFLAGAFEGTMDFGAPAGSITANGRDAFLARTTTALAPVSARAYGDALTDAAHGLATSSMFTVIGGEFGSSITFKSGTANPLAATDAPDGFVSLLKTSTNAFADQAGFSAAGTQVVRAVSVSDASNAFAGSFVGTVDFGGLAPRVASDTDAFVVRRNGSMPLWDLSMGAVGSTQSATAVDISPNGITVVGGTHTGAFDVLGHAVSYLSDNSTTDLFVLAIDD
ncbi:MAG: hypothetical protein U0414_14185 [Polyangiaceae bacterium]